MSLDRRDFFEMLAAVGSAALLGGDAAQMEGQSEQSSEAGAGFDTSAASYWTNLFQRAPSASLGVSHSGDERTPRFFIHTPQSGFRVPTSPPVKAEELPELSRPSIKLRVLAFKPSTEDSGKFDASQSGTLRIDLLQAGMLNADQGVAKASTAIAGLASSSGKVQPASVTGVTIGGENSFMLPDGGGYLNWTFFLQKKDALWHKALAAMMIASKLGATAFMPVLSLASVAKTDWGAFNSLAGGLLPAPTAAQGANKSTYWVFTPSLLQVAASQKAYQDPMFADGIPMIKGAHYVVVPQAHYKQFGHLMEQMELAQGGYVVPKGTNPVDAFDAAYNTPELKDVSYLTLHCEAVTEATGCTEAGGKTGKG